MKKPARIGNFFFPSDSEDVLDEEELLLTFPSLSELVLDEEDEQDRAYWDRMKDEY